MWDICADCTEEFVSNEVIRVVLPPHQPENHFIIELLKLKLYFVDC